MARSRKSVDALIGEALASPHPDDAAAFADPARPFAVAWSGGLDSSVLLDAAVRAAGAARVVAIHVHHGLQPAADDWVAHCAREAARLGVRCATLRAAGAPGPGDSVEAWARGERYRLLRAAAREARAAALLTAHHADDQLETLLLMLARGCGLDGLTGIAARDVREGVTLLRPLLALDRAALEAQARARGLAWVDDPSNADPVHARSALRGRAMPALRDALPGLAAQVADTLALLGEARATLDALGRDDLSSTHAPRAAARAARPASRAPQATHASQASHASPVDPAAIARVAAALPEADGASTARGPLVLDRVALASLPAARRAGALRAWLAALGAPNPPRARLAQMLAQLVDGDGAHGEVGHAGWRLLRHRDRLIAVPPALAGSEPGEAPVVWRGEAALALPAPWGGSLHARPAANGISAAWLAARPLRLAPAASAARLRAEPGGPARTLKNLWQEAGVPRWLRPRFPALWDGARLLMAAPFGPHRDPSLPGGDDAVDLAWRPDAPDDPRAWWLDRPDDPGA